MSTSSIISLAVDDRHFNGRTIDGLAPRDLFVRFPEVAERLRQAGYALDRPLEFRRDRGNRCVIFTQLRPPTIPVVASMTVQQLVEITRHAESRFSIRDGELWFAPHHAQALRAIDISDQSPAPGPAPAPDPPTCGNCRFSRRKYSDGVVECRRHAPQAGQSGWAGMASDQWCGEHEPKAEA